MNETETPAENTGGAATESVTGGAEPNLGTTEAQETETMPGGKASKKYFNVTLNKESGERLDALMKRMGEGTSRPMVVSRALKALERELDSPAIDRGGAVLQEGQGVAKRIGQGRAADGLNREGRGGEAESLTLHLRMMLTAEEKRVAERFGAEVAGYTIRLPADERRREEAMKWLKGTNLLMDSKFKAFA